MIVWALFDSETATVAKALPEHEVYCFGIGNGTEHINLDLADFKTARNTLDKYPKPDIIFASPPCESWVAVSRGNISKMTNEKGFNFHWKCKWIAFDFNEKAKKTRINGINTALTTAMIIQYYRPKYWAIENGSSSLLFSYLYQFPKLIGVKNKCNYYSYGFDVLKPTIIYSNKTLYLNEFKPKKLLRSVNDDDSGKLRLLKKNLGLEGVPVKHRSDVPPRLYQAIMNQFAPKKSIL